MEAINNVSEVLQSPTTDVLNAQSQITTLTNELLRLRSDECFSASVTVAESLAQQ